ncbi:hypothetical protein RIF29_12928 [Crotalaria pallida]|uniref:Uncharacterized protein n=1 Tax=Crotalaria pallida TaxID=3830 RepID=A0AAN9INZ1_CROPI
MEAIRIRTPKKNGRGTFINYHSTTPSENFDTYAGLLNPSPRALSLSSASVFNNYNYIQQNQQQQPPLLPLPPNVSSIIHHQQQQHQPHQLSRSMSCIQNMAKKNRTRDMSLLTPKKSKPTKREEAKKRISSATQSSISDFLIVASDNPWGPDPKHLPKNLTVLSPPPSSLPLPKFCLRSKLSCNAEAAGVDAGATDNLRQLLRLR